MTTTVEIPHPCPPGQKPELALIYGGLAGTELENPWGVEYPHDLVVNVFPHPEKEPWKNVSIVETAWTAADGKYDARLWLGLYPRGRSIIVTDVIRPRHWGEDRRDLDVRVEELQVGLAASLETVIDLGRTNPLGRNPYAAPNSIEIFGLTGVAGEALAKLSLPDTIKRQDILDYSGGEIASLSFIDAIRMGGNLTTTLKIDRDNMSELGSVAMRVNATRPEQPPMPQLIPRSIYV